MKFLNSLHKGYLIKRYKRFLSDVRLEDGSMTTAHCPNPGAIQGLDKPETPVWLSRSPNPDRKLPYTWEMAEVEGTYVGVNTQHPNSLVEEAILEGKIPQFMGFKSLKREVKYGKNSRIDLLLETAEGKLAYIEVKNVHMKRGERAAFPSSVTTRGAKHMNELGLILEEGHHAYLIYVVQRNDCNAFELAHDIDPAYGKAALRAFEKGVIPLVYACDLSPDGINISHPIELKL